MDQIAVYLPGILLAYSAFLLSIISPGPNLLAILGTSMSAGRRPGVALAFGISTGSFIWAMLTAIGLSALIASYALALTVIKVAGGLFLLWLAYKSFRSAVNTAELEVARQTAGDDTMVRCYMRGLMVQMTNPKAALAWVAIISLGLQAGAPAWVALVIVLGTAFLSVVVHLLYALAFSTTVVLRVYGRARRWIQGVLGLFFAFAGLKLLVSRT